jgi:transposase
MRYFAALDVSIKETSICIVDDEGRIVREAKVVTEPAAIVAELTRCGIIYGRVGLEAGPLSQWLYNALAEAGLPVICVQTRHMKAALSALTNKPDRNVARGIAAARAQAPEDRGGRACQQDGAHRLGGHGGDEIYEARAA